MSPVPSADPRVISLLEAVREERINRALAAIAADPTLAIATVHTAAACGDAEAVEGFLKTDPACATRPSAPDGTSPLLYAAHSGLQNALRAAGHPRAVDGLATVRMLLDGGASPNTFRELDGSPPARIPALYFACVSDNLPVVSLLLERGADVNDGESVYHAAELDHRDCLALLLAHGADISGRHEHWGNTPLYFLAGFRETHSGAAAIARGMAWLLAHGADPNVASNVAAGHHGAPDTGEAPLHRIAAFGRSVSLARLLVTHGAAVDMARADGRTPYALAIRAGNTEVAEYLAASGASTDRLDPIDQLLGACAVADEQAARAIVARNPGIVERMRPADWHAISGAIDSDREPSVRLMLSLGWPLEEEGPWGGTPLHHAAWQGQPGITRLLLSHGAPVDVRDRVYGSSPIAWAAHGSVNARPGNDADYLAVVTMLLDAGATRAPSYNAWGEPPEQLGSDAVVALLRARRFAE